MSSNGSVILGRTIDRPASDRQPHPLCYREAPNTKSRAWSETTMTLRLFAVACAALAAIATAQDTAHAQSYPSRPVTIIVPYPAGGPTDQVTRQIAPKMGDKLGQNFVIENISGGGTNIAGQRVARS